MATPYTRVRLNRAEADAAFKRADERDGERTIHYREPSVAEKGGDAPGINAGSQRSHKGLASGCWDRQGRKVAKNGKVIREGYVTRDAAKGFKAKPITGGFGELWETPGKTTSGMLIAEANAIMEDDSKSFHPRSHRLAESAGLYIAAQIGSREDLLAEVRDVLSRQRDDGKRTDALESIEEALTN